MLDAGADPVGDQTQAHMVAIDARAPLCDGGICTRIDCVSLGVAVNREGAPFYDEGEDFRPKRHAIWGRLVAQQPGADRLVGDRRQGGRPLHAGGVSRRARRPRDLARPLGLPGVSAHAADYDAACRAAASTTPRSTTAIQRA